MINVAEIGQWRQLLRSFDNTELEKIMNSIDPRKSAEFFSKEKLVSRIVDNTVTSEQLLGRKYITVSMLYRYARSSGINLPRSAKEELVRSILAHWRRPGTATARRPRLNRYEFRECENILNILPESELHSFWRMLYPNAAGSLLKPEVIKGILFRMPAVLWLLRRRAVSTEVLIRYLSEEGIFPDSNQKEHLIQEVLDHIKTLNQGF